LAATSNTSCGKKAPGYVCSSRERGPVECGCHGIPAKVIDNVTWARVGAVLTQPEIDRAAIVARHEGWQLDLERLNNVHAWCRNIAGKLGTFTYEQKRLAREALGVQVRLCPTSHEPRYVITASIPLGAAEQDQGRQVSRLYAASQNHHS
jgi:hypothetical protein